MMRIVVTGASGYIGTRFLRHAQAGRHEVVVASRNRFEPALSWLPFDLNTPSTFILPEGVDAILHLAAATTDGNHDGRDEVAAAKSLIAAAGRNGTRFIFVSSQTADENAPTSYGRIKWRIEQEVLAAHGIVVRVGQVYGGPEQGLFGALVRLVDRLPVLPVFIPAPMIQPIHVDDCVKGLWTFLEREDIPSRIYCLASPAAVPFSSFLQTIAGQRLRSRRLFVPAPVFLVELIRRTLSENLSTTLGLSRLSSLFGLPPMHTTPDLNAIGLELRSLRSGMHRSGADRRRRLVLEGTALLHYLLRKPPSSMLVRRYVRMIETLRKGTPLSFPPWLFRNPVALALMDDRGFVNSLPGEEFGWRVDAAAVIAEASVQGASRFIGGGRSTPFIAALAQMGLAVCAELFWRISRRALRPILDWTLRREGLR
uniref:NAD-dependent epimerase/dehydratase domain-containing protein n=1 Tax=uncultured microorganism TaxID=358574 RepID=I2FJJ4_9ZZZZ|nr:hypothetical protein [uncultured microorganism]